MENELKKIRVTEYLSNSDRIGYVAAGALFAFVGVTLTKAACHAIAMGIVGKDVSEANGTFEVE